MIYDEARSKPVTPSSLQRSLSSHLIGTERDVYYTFNGEERPSPDKAVYFVTTDQTKTQQVRKDSDSQIMMPKPSSVTRPHCFDPKMWSGSWSELPSRRNLGLHRDPSEVNVVVPSQRSCCFASDFLTAGRRAGARQPPVALKILCLVPS
jgi:hypothetical protein